MLYTAFGENLKTLRTARGLTQKELGDRVGLSKAVISKYENALGYPTLDMVITLAAFFGVTTDHLLGVKNQKTADVSGLTDWQLNAVLTVINAFKHES